MTNPGRIMLVPVFVALLVAPPARADDAAKLEVTLSVSGARLELDDTLVAESAGRSHAQPLTPGVHILRVTKEGFQATARRIEAVAGQVSKVEVALSPGESGSNRTLTRIALQQVATSGEVDPRIVTVVTEALLAELRKLEKTAVVGMSEVNEMLSFEQQRQLLGCEESSCLAEIAGALGVDQLLTGSIGALGDSVLFSLRRTDLNRARVLGSVSRRLTMRTGEELLAELGPSIQELFPEFELREGRRRGASIQAARQLNPPPIPKWAFFAGVGVTAISAGFAAFSGVGFQSAQTEYATLAGLSQTQVVAGADLMAAAGRAQAAAQQANLALAVTAGLAAVTGVGALFTNFWEGEGAPVAVFVPQGDGASVALAGAF